MARRHNDIYKVFELFIKRYFTNVINSDFKYFVMQRTF